MANPLATTGMGSSGGDLPPGGVRVIEARDKSGNIVKTVTVYRTDREYVYDLRDAYNAALSPAARERGAEWIVTPTGELKLGDNEEWSRHNRRAVAQRMETERSRFLRRQLENARTPDEPA